MPNLSKLKTQPDLAQMLREAAKRQMTPGEIWDQRVSFVYGQMMDCAPGITKEQVRREAERVYGPRPIV